MMGFCQKENYHFVVDDDDDDTDDSKRMMMMIVGGGQDYCDCDDDLNEDEDDEDSFLLFVVVVDRIDERIFWGIYVFQVLPGDVKYHQVLSELPILLQIQNTFQIRSDVLQRRKMIYPLSNFRQLILLTNSILNCRWIQQKFPDHRASPAQIILLYRRDWPHSLFHCADNWYFYE